jgi:hypothetical protein
MRKHTPAQLAAIECAIQRAPKKGPLTKDENDLLYFAATLYGCSPETWELFRRWDVEDCNRWRKISFHLAETEKYLRSLKEDQGLSSLFTPEFLATLKPLREMAEKLASWKAHLNVPAFDALKEDICKVLPNKQAKALVRDIYNPRTIFYENIADLWAHRGGNVATTWDESAGRGKEISGAFVEFFEAVARPIMGSATPSRHSIRDFMRKAKRRRAAWHQFQQHRRPLKG